MSILDGLFKRASELSSARRNALSSGEFALSKERRYPIEDKAHARNALARVSQHGSPAEKAEVRKDVHNKYPDIGEKHAASKEQLLNLLKKHEARETPKQEAEESKEEQKLEEDAGVHEKKAFWGGFGKSLRP